MRILGYRIRSMRAYGPLWWLVFVAMLALAFGCREVTAPITMQAVPSESLVVANLKANGWNPTAGTQGICNPGARGTIAQVSVCFAQLWRVLAIGAGAATTCASAIGAARTPRGAWAAGSVCSLGLFATYDGLERYVEATDVGRWANQSAEEIANRMRQAIYERMVARGEWRENAGCC